MNEIGAFYAIAASCETTGIILRTMRIIVALGRLAIVFMTKILGSSGSIVGR